MIKSADANGSARGTARALAFVSMTFLGLANMAPICNGGGAEVAAARTAAATQANWSASPIRIARLGALVCPTPRAG
jgi:hypothetical protein